MGPVELTDWKSDKVIRYNGIARDGFMCNGINDSNHRGVWFYNHFLHPWAPAPDEIIVELTVSRSSTHKSAKWHRKYCASPDVDAPGEKNLHTSISAIHIHSSMVG